MPVHFLSGAKAEFSRKYKTFVPVPDNDALKLGGEVVSKWEPGVSEDDMVEHRIATARTEARKAALEEAARECPIPKIDAAPSFLDRHSWHLGYMRAVNDFEARIRSLIGTDPATDREEG